MTCSTPSVLPTTSLVHRLREATGISLALCRQCGVCTAACPEAGDMDLQPCRMVRLAQAGFGGFDRRVLGSEAIWLCTGCSACSQKCPLQVDLPRVMAFFRQESACLGLVHPEAPPRSTPPVSFGGTWQKPAQQTVLG